MTHLLGKHLAGRDLTLPKGTKDAFGASRAKLPAPLDHPSMAPGHTQPPLAILFFTDRR